MSYNTAATESSQSLNGWPESDMPSPLEGPRRLKERRSIASERKRAVRACDQCRRVKEKCEGGVPCRRCRHFRRACEFMSIASRSNDPKPSPGGSSTSDALLREQRNRILRDRVRYMERILKHEIKGISLDTESLRVRAEAIPEEGCRSERFVSPDGSSGEELAIEDEICTIDPVEGDTATHYSGEFSYWNFSMRIKRHLEDRIQSLSEQTENTHLNSDYVRAGQLQSSSDNLSIAISCYPPRSIADFLVRIFFDFAETHYFYVVKSWLLDKLNIIYDNPTTLTIKDAATVSIILTVFAIGTQYAYLDSPTQHERVPTASKYSEDEIGTMFYQQAIRLLPEIIESSTLESVQATLLFAVYALPIDASGLGYIYVNLALRLGMQNGMHRRYTGSVLSDIMIETRNRVWWSASALERKICIFHGRPLSMLQSDIDADLPKDLGDMEQAELPSNAPLMCASIHLTHKLEDYSNQINLSRSYQKQETPSLSARLLTIKTELAAWWSNLDILQDQDSYQAHHRSTMHLRLEFCLVRMFVGRPFLFGHQSTRSNSNSPSSTSNSQTPTPSNNEKRISPRTILVEDCVHAAKEALEICRSLRDDGHGLARGSYIEYSSCRASLLVLIAYCVQNRSDQFQTIVQDGLVMIRDMSAAGESARSEVAFIEVLDRALKFRDNSNSSASVDLGSSYDSFKHWESMWKNGGATHSLRDDLRTKPTNSFAMKPEASTSSWQSSAVLIDPIDHTTSEWPTSILSTNNSDNFFAMPSSNVNLAYSSNNDLAPFEERSLRLGTDGNMFTMQGVAESVTNMEFDFNVTGLPGIENGTEWLE